MTWVKIKQTWVLVCRVSGAPLHPPAPVDVASQSRRLRQGSWTDDRSHDEVVWTTPVVPAAAPGPRSHRLPTGDTCRPLATSHRASQRWYAAGCPGPPSSSTQTYKRHRLAFSAVRWHQKVPDTLRMYSIQCPQKTYPIIKHAEISLLEISKMAASGHLGFGPTGNRCI